ncbi:MAG: HAMP domain-containing sensor histidine kinase [Ferruginibacter sp.]
MATANIDVIFISETYPEDIKLPTQFKGLAAPASKEVETENQTFLVLAREIQAPDGTLFISKDITAIEDRENLFQLGMLGVVIVMIVIGFLLSQMAARKLVKPLQKLTYSIQKTTPGTAMQRLKTDYKEQEYVDIAEAFNRFLNTMEDFVNRENIFIKTASHELRTPIAILSGALDVIEKRQQLSTADQQTLKRIRQTVSNMEIEVNTLLELLRNERPVSDTDISLGELINESVTELCSEMPQSADRIKHIKTNQDQSIVWTHKPLLRMLIRNLLHNALQHTQGEVLIQAENNAINVADFGTGLPLDVHQRLTKNPARLQTQNHEARFGLLIAQMVSEKLNIKLNVLHSDSSGVTMQIYFPPAN